ncbi:hypothetical protein EJB05_23886, partial [Eragrostis curvula]
MKVNVDAAISKNTGKMVISAVARDSSGLFLGASAVVAVGLSEPKTMEALAVREGPALATDLCLQSFRLASDNANGVYGHIVQEIKATTRVFTKVEMVHEGRATNGDAHRLARGSIYEEVGRHVWLIYPPEGV